MVHPPISRVLKPIVGESIAPRLIQASHPSTLARRCQRDSIEQCLTRHLAFVSLGSGALTRRGRAHVAAAFPFSCWERAGEETAGALCRSRMSPLLMTMGGNSHGNTVYHLCRDDWAGDLEEPRWRGELDAPATG